MAKEIKEFLNKKLRNIKMICKFRNSLEKVEEYYRMF